MANDFDKLVCDLCASPTSIDVVHNLSSFIKQQTIELLDGFISQSYKVLLTLERWSWQLLSADTLQWIDETAYIELLHTLALFNHSLIFNCNILDGSSKAALLLPESMDQINRILQHIEHNTDENSPYLMILSRFLNNHSYFLLDHFQYSTLDIIDHLGKHFTRNSIMSPQFKHYLTELQHPHVIQTKIPAKMLFYLKTSAFYFHMYLSTRYRNFPYTSDEMVRHLRDYYLRIIHMHVPTIEQWSEEFLACIAHLVALLCRCCWWGGKIVVPMKILLPTEQIACEYVQDLMKILAHAPIYKKIRNQSSNDETILFESTIFFLFQVVETQSINWLFRSNAFYQETLLTVAQLGLNDIICLGAYNIMGVVLTDAEIKELKICDGAVALASNMLGKAWHESSQMYKQVSIVNILQGVRYLSKNDSVQQKIADFNQIPLFLEMCDEYPLVYDILWALSFNRDIQQQLRTNSSFMSKLAHLGRKNDNIKTRKIIHGLMWNLETPIETDPDCQIRREEIFDVMISYSHKNKKFCKQLYEELVKIGYRVWIDFDQMHGNVMDAMAQAIEQSQTVIICLSEDYRKSNYCRAEAHYAFQRQRKIVPVLIQKRYKPDGWLLFLVGQLLYVDFTKHEFSEAVKMLQKEFQPFLIIGTNPLTTSEEKDIQMTSPVSPVYSQNILEWTSADVQQWLLENKLIQMARLLVDCDGRSLTYLGQYMKHSNIRHMLDSFRKDSLGRLNEHLSYIELSRLHSLLDKQHLDC